MTTGNYTFGDAFKPLYSTKTWSGADGKVIVNGHIRWNQYSCYGCTWRKSPDKAGDIIHGQLNLPDSILSSELEVLKLMLCRKIKGHQFNLGTFLGQWNQTAEMVVDTAAGLASAASQLRHGNPAGAWKALKKMNSKRGRHLGPAPRPGANAADTWLAYHFGWVPLLGDVKDAAESAAAITDRPRRLQFKVSRSFDRGQLASNVSGWTHKGVHKCNASLFAYLTEDISTPRSLGLLSPASVAWELLPWSFVIDWFLPIGNYLEVLETLPFLTPTVQCSYLAINKGKVSWEINEGPWAWQYPASCVGTCFASGRFSTTSYPALPSFELPGKSLASKVFTSLSLARQKF
jgi:hypothetical protein